LPELCLRAGAVAFEWAKVLARKEWIVGHTGAATAAQQYQQEGITLFKGAAAFEDAHRVRVDGQVLRGEKIMIATGSKPAMPSIPGEEDGAGIYVQGLRQDLRCGEGAARARQDL
jgi:pyruvate/2-oxoglutarate dehydrogenase complex dihydrolipoamide dehydrogenase (E3) component